MSFKSDRLSSYLNQTVSWNQKSTQNKFNEATYSMSNISARKQPKRQMVKNEKGEEVISETTVMTLSAVGMEDQIDGENVITVTEWIDTDGTTIGYKVFL